MKFSNEDVEDFQQAKSDIKRELKKHTKNELIAYITTLLFTNAELRAELAAIDKLYEVTDGEMDNSSDNAASNRSTSEE